MEVQVEIWKLVPSSPPAPEVCIVWPPRAPSPPRWPLFYRDNKSVDPAFFIVDTAWPALAHVCRASREIALRSPELRLRYSPVAGIAVPFRAFDPDMDTLYWNHHQTEMLSRFLECPDNKELVSKIRYLAIELKSGRENLSMGSCLSIKTISLRNLAYVLPSSSFFHDASVAFVPPTRRCRLVDIPESIVAGIIVTGCTHQLAFVKNPQDVQYTQSLRPYLEMRREKDFIQPMVQLSMLEMQCCRRLTVANALAGRPPPHNNAEPSLATRTKGIKEMEIKVQTFVEYKRTEGKGEEWVESCGQRLLNGTNCACMAIELPLPAPDEQTLYTAEEYRVLDDLGRWWDGLRHGPVASSS